jgi:uncharacterized membrane protein YccC
MAKENKTAKYAGLLTRYLEKLGLKSSVELDKDERATYDQWRETLTKELTVEDLADVMRAELAEVNADLREAVKKGDDRAAQIAVARIENYESLLALIERRERSREELAEHISRLIDT